MRRNVCALSLLLLCQLTSLRGADVPNAKPVKVPADTPLPDLGRQGGVRYVDLNADGYEDLIISNPSGYGVYLFNPVEKKNVQWPVGWTNVMREGKTGDANSIPLIARADGKENSIVFKDGAMQIQADGRVQSISYEDLLKVPGPAPKSPRDSLAALQLKPGYTARLAAHEPMVQDPVFVDWDARGRMWVVEMGDYPFAPGETTKDGQVGQGKVSPLQTGRIKILEDTDGDGVYDKATLFLEGLTHPTSLAPWKNGVFVASIPDIFYAEDTDGDGRCDKKEVWYTGFTAGNPQHLVNGFCWGLDGWFYGANGDSGGEITNVKTGTKAVMSTNDFRFNPLTAEFQLDAGRSQYGKWRDDYGNWFGNNNSIWGWHYWLPMQYLARHPELPVKTLRQTLNDSKEVFPISPPMRRFNWASATSTLTSGCSPMPYRDALLGADGRNVLFVCEPANNLVHREVLDYSHPAISSSCHPADAASEFIASRDNWFRPSMARTGPDGALYVVDMYRLVLEHPEWIPADMVRHMNVRAGEDKGRIYIIRPDNGPPNKKIVLEAASDSELTTALKSSNGWVRDTAQRLLIERAAKSTVPALVKMAQSPDLAAQARIQAAFTALLLGGLAAEDAAALLRNFYPHVRAAALIATGATAGDLLTPGELALIQEQATQKSAKSIVKVPVITNVNPDRQKVVARYNEAVAALKGDPSHGQAAFQKICFTCHKAHGLGIEVGPDLGTVATKPREQLIESIFDPSKAVEVRNAGTQVTRKDGSVIVGLLSSETPNNLTLRLPGGAETSVLKSEIKEAKTLQTSLMPDGLENLLTPQEVADLLAWMAKP